MGKTKLAKVATDSLNGDNYREYAKRAIDAYSRKGMIADAMLWSAIIGHYDRALDETKIDDLGEKR